MATPSILIVDDDTRLVKLICDALKHGGYDPHVEEGADDAIAYLKSHIPALVLLDIRLPGLNGLQLLEIIKQDSRTSGLPVIMMTSEAKTPTKVKGLQVGADDYIVKPFEMAELIARIGALLRRVHQGGRNEDVFEAGKLRVDFDRQEVTVDGKGVALTPMEFQLLTLFVKHKSYVISYRTLSESLSGGTKVMTSQNLYYHIQNLRTKLGKEGDRIETVHGSGYKFTDA